MRKEEVLVIVGPTASGKSDLAVRIARKLGGEIVSADSRQVYKGLDIGTGKITKSERKGIPHHLLDIANPQKQFTVAEWKKLALLAIKKTHAEGKLPIVVGGTGFYIETLTLDLPEVPPNRELRTRLKNKSAEDLFKMLERLDPRRAGAVDRHNKVRLIRAIEIAESLGKVPKAKKHKIFDFIYIGLKPQDLERRIEKRLKSRMSGMIKEAKRLHKKGLSWRRMEELGLEYRYLSRYLKGGMTKEQMTDDLFKEIKNYAKRQMTWFRKNKDIKWFRNPADAFVSTRKLKALSRQLRQR